MGIEDAKLQFFTEVGQRLPSPQELAEAERQQRELAQQEVAVLKAKLRELGVDPDRLK